MKKFCKKALINFFPGQLTSPNLQVGTTPKIFLCELSQGRKEKRCYKIEQIQKGAQRRKVKRGHNAERDEKRAQRRKVKRGHNAEKDEKRAQRRIGAVHCTRGNNIESLVIVLVE